MYMFDAGLCQVACLNKAREGNRSMLKSVMCVPVENLLYSWQATLL